ncbi:MAG: hypothetical protein LBU90_10840 [Bacteroidales bacterium]|jgi:hypothetical protein|nr:hypothetical protein [Bacteroidales bacterium]
MKKITILICTALMFFASACVDSPPGPSKSAEQLRQELWQVETTTPLSYLNTKNVSCRAKGLFGGFLLNNGAEIEGRIENRATLAAYGYVMLEVTYFSSNGSPLMTSYYVLNQGFAASTSTYFSITVPAEEYPSAMDSFSCRIIDAAPIM